MNKITTIYFQEHESKEKDKVPEIQNLIENSSLKLKGYPDDYMGIPEYLGISDDNNQVTSAYYIGATWLRENEIAAIVEPKINGIDFVRMFADALEIDTEFESSYFSKCYGIDFNSSPIPIKTTINLITPLILLHYIYSLKKLTKYGLKKGYVYREQNLQSKIKGKILYQRQFKTNVIIKREDRTFCGYNEYTIDIPENRLLKKALLFTERAINYYPSLKKQEDFFNNILVSINQLKSFFADVSEEIEIQQVKRVSTNKIFRTYDDAISIAKNILRRFDYSIQNTEEEQKDTVPFWIDMPRLYELYVYKKLHDNFKDELKFQVPGYQGSAVDYVLTNQKLILDAKYKPRYSNSNRGILDDIREISGYARDRNILKNFKNPPAIVPCIILYPEVFDDSEESTQDGILNPTTNLLNAAIEIKAFEGFYKFKIGLPKIQ